MAGAPSVGASVGLRTCRVRLDRRRVYAARARCQRLRARPLPGGGSMKSMLDKSTGKESVMTRRLRWLWVTPAFLMVVSLGAGTAVAADKTKVDEATKQVAQGAKQIGQGSVGPGFVGLFKGIGN